MKVLAIDTSTTQGSIAIVKNNNTIVGEIYINLKTTHSERIGIIANSLLEITEISLNDIDCLVASIGPGSFTGIRIGLSFFKGIAFSLNKPLIGITSIDALANNVNLNNKFCAFIEGRNKEVFYAIYENNKKISNYLIGNIEILKSLNIPLFGFFNTLDFEKIAKKINLFAHDFGFLGLKEFNKKKENAFSSNINPLYLKKSDAEINYKQKNNK